MKQSGMSLFCCYCYFCCISVFSFVVVVIVIFILILLIFSPPPPTPILFLLVFFRPDITVMADWALNTNYLAIFFLSSSYDPLQMTGYENPFINSPPPSSLSFSFCFFVLFACCALLLFFVIFLFNVFRVFVVVVCFWCVYVCVGERMGGGGCSLFLFFCFVF